jgi:CO/xanthine dehydrogenase FAD-binding subunit
LSLPRIGEKAQFRSAEPALSARDLLSRTHATRQWVSRCCTGPDVKPASFAYHRPQTVEQALQLLGELGEARPLAGGQSLVPMMNMRLARPEHLVDLNDLANLAYIRETDGAVVLGAMTRHRTVEQSALLTRQCPILPAAARTIGHGAIRERGTVGGSLALADPSAQWPLLAVLLDARIELAAQGGRRAVSAGDFLTGVFATAIAPGEIIASVAFPPLAAGEGWSYRGFTRRHGDFAIVAAAATVALDADGRLARLRLAVSGVADRPIRLDTVAAARGRVPDDAMLADLGRAAAAAVAPHDDAVASAAFRRDLVEALTAGVVGDAIERARTKR